MDNKIGKIGVFTSGGDAPGMNAAIRAVVRACAYYKKEAFGIMRGYEGMIEGDFVKLGPRSVGNIIQRGFAVAQFAEHRLGCLQYQLLFCLCLYAQFAFR